MCAEALSGGSLGGALGSFAERPRRSAAAGNSSESQSAALRLVTTKSRAGENATLRAAPLVGSPISPDLSSDFQRSCSVCPAWGRAAKPS